MLFLVKWSAGVAWSEVMEQIVEDTDPIEQV